MTRVELRTAIILTIVFTLRLTGLFIIYPGFVAYPYHFVGASSARIGIALSIYGLTQALLQVPFGLLSDRFGRKPLIAIGFAVFAIGSVIAALATSVEGLMFGRALQGAGAVGSTILALIADLTRKGVHTRAMALVGTSIALSFMIAAGLGPSLAAEIGVSGIFWLTASLALLGIALTYYGVPAAAPRARHRASGAGRRSLLRMIRNIHLLRLYFGIFTLHVILTASFLAVLNTLPTALHTESGNEWVVYLPVLLAAVGLTASAILVAEKRGRMKEVFLAAIALLATSQLILAFEGSSATGSLVALVGLLTVFNIMEASLPSLISKTAPVDSRGMAMGIFSSAQFLGMFVAGSFEGLFTTAHGIYGVFAFSVIAAFLWLVVAANMRRSNGNNAGSSRNGIQDQVLSRR